MILCILWFKNLIKFILSSCIAVFILCCFCYVYNYSGVHITNETGATDYIWEPGQWKATMTEGFAWFHMDDSGYNNTNVKVLQSHESPNILLMGSSHMEAVSIDDSENTGYLLNEMLPDSTVYNIGTSGHTIIPCVNNMEDAVRKYKPSDYVILETGNVCPNEDEMLEVIHGRHERIPSYDSGVLYFLQTKLPAVKAVYKSLQDWRAGSIDHGDVREDDAAGEAGKSFSSGYDNTLSSFLEIAGKAVSDSGAKLIIFYHPGSEIGWDGRLIDTTDPEALRLFRSACEENGILFVDMTEPFRRLYEEEHILAYGFVNTSAGAGHLNKYGHCVIAETLSDFIKTDMERGNEPIGGSRENSGEGLP